MRDFIKAKLDEALHIQEKEKPEEGGSKYDKIKGLLDNPIFNHSEIIRKLWKKDDATARSLFKKKLDRASNDSGSTYKFDDEELSKIASILMDTSTQIRKDIGKSGAA